jgi:hypothetical protein
MVQNEEYGGYHKRTFGRMDATAELTWMYSQRVRVDARHVPLCNEVMPSLLLCCSIA